MNTRLVLFFRFSFCLKSFAMKSPIFSILIQFSPIEWVSVPVTIGRKKLLITDL